MTAAALNPGMLKHGKVMDINNLHVSLAHAHASVLQATVRQHDFCLTGELASCSACSMAKGNRAQTAHHTTARTKRPMELVDIGTAGPFPASLGGSRYVVVFVDIASRLERPYGTRDKIPDAILAVAKGFIADMEVPRALRRDNGIHELFISGILQQPRDSTRVDGAVYASTKWSRGERTLESV